MIKKYLLLLICCAGVSYLQAQGQNNKALEDAKYALNQDEKNCDVLKTLAMNLEELYKQNLALFNECAGNGGKHCTHAYVNKLRQKNQEINEALKSLHMRMNQYCAAENKGK